MTLPRFPMHSVIAFPAHTHRPSSQIMECMGNLGSSLKNSLDAAAKVPQALHHGIPCTHTDRALKSLGEFLLLLPRFPMHSVMAFPAHTRTDLALKIIPGRVPDDTAKVPHTLCYDIPCTHRLSIIPFWTMFLFAGGCNDPYSVTSGTVFNFTHPPVLSALLLIHSASRFIKPPL